MALEGGAEQSIPGSLCALGLWRYRQLHCPLRAALPARLLAGAFPRARPGWQGRSRPVRPQLQLGPAPGGRRGCCGSGSGARGSDKRSILSSRAGAAAGPVRGMCAVIGSGMREPSQPPVSTVTAVRCHPSVQLSPREGRGSFSLLTRCKCPLSG